MYIPIISFFLISLAFSFLCSLWEAVLLSIPSSYVHAQQEKQSPLGVLLFKLKNNVDQPLAAILTLNTIAHTVGAIGVGVEATKLWETVYPFVTAFVVPTVMTLAILIFSEIIPKTIGATYWKQWAGFTAHSLRFLITALYPLVLLSQFMTKLIKPKKKESTLSKDEMVALTEVAAKEGVFDEGESHMLANLLKFDTVKAKDIMTPRSVTFMASEEMTMEEFYEKNPKVRFSRIPVYKNEDRDKITGYILKNQIFTALLEDQGSLPLKSIRREITIAEVNSPVIHLFNKFMTQREHVALVMDEYGGFAGLVTFEDIIETMLGMEIVDESDRHEDMQLLARRSWERRAKAMGIEINPLENEEKPNEGKSNGDILNIQ